MHHRFSIHKNLLKPEGGFTTVELIIAIQLSLIVIGLVYVSYLLSIKLVDKWQTKVQVENQLASISKSITVNLTEISQIIYAGENEMMAIKDDGDTINYRLKDTFSFNKQILQDSNLKFEHGEILYYVRPVQSTSNMTVLKNVESGNFTRIVAVEFSMEFKGGKRSYPLSVYTRLLKLKPVIVMK
jgi:hypothetical protein